MAEKKGAPKKSKVAVSKKTVKDLKLKPGKGDAVKGGILVNGGNLMVRR